MEHFIVISGPVSDIAFAQSAPEETDTSVHMRYGLDVESIPAADASRTFDWVTDDAWEWSFATYADHQVWHIVDGVVTEYMNCTI